MKQSFTLDGEYESEILAATGEPIDVIRAQRVKLIVGSDGLGVDSVAPRRIVPFRSISHVEVSRGDLLTIEHARGFAFFRGVDAKRKSAADLVQDVLRVITFRRDRFRAAIIGRSAIEQLVTNGSPSNRIAQLRLLGASPTSPYRQMSVARDELWRLVESPATSVSECIAAIVVLRACPVEDFVTRVGATAEDLVDDVAARSLRMAAHGSDGELEALFAEEETIDAAALSLPERLRRRRGF